MLQNRTFRIANSEYYHLKNFLYTTEPSSEITDDIVIKQDGFSVEARVIKQAVQELLMPYPTVRRLVGRTTCGDN